MIEISVMDTGKGISKEKLQKVFTGSMESSRGTAGEKGTGLGLILSKEFVEKRWNNSCRKLRRKRQSILFYNTKCRG